MKNIETSILFNIHPYTNSTNAVCIAFVCLRLRRRAKTVEVTNCGAADGRKVLFLSGRGSADRQKQSGQPFAEPQTEKNTTFCPLAEPL